MMYEIFRNLLQPEYASNDMYIVTHSTGLRMEEMFYGCAAPLWNLDEMSV